MGNCQAAEAATVVIEHPDGKIQRIYWSVSANEIMTLNPGHYVAAITVSPTAKSENGAPLRQLKLLRPDDTMHIGHVYRLISFEEVLKEFSGKKYARLSRLLSLQKKPRSNGGGERRETSSRSDSEKLPKPERDVHKSGTRVARHGQWRPALQSIAEVGR
ncbi:hypothetical protein AMTRI_Chr12g239130 [Amborella trichopoda]|uniref:DUF4228 domain-containing protein n=1 Tax=Amborella trichopoda TaxID=13333 RepID=U5DB08_AMBTC|nr:uncharacterized protein LOC18446971 [Amborella trichopoda]ERN18602.1 hypothetical protein AMTR_s00065p00150950 [Amborella trichopoda]|eukprot:XP_006857135.1 uncharacterized protein LOC18446971 [Amborella trichopoda]